MHIDTFHIYFSLEAHNVGLSKMKYTLLGFFLAGGIFCETT